MNDVLAQWRACEAGLAAYASEHPDDKGVSLNLAAARKMVRKLEGRTEAMTSTSPPEGDKADEIARDVVGEWEMLNGAELPAFMRVTVAAALRAYGDFCRDQWLEAAAKQVSMTIRGNGDFGAMDALPSLVRSLKSKPESKEPTA